ncbi:FtsK/SpoIIIE family DNA translocase [Atopococcus tabaci]|uniref:FtsK/SpoIIIE family DNA translocase n=1 Tax=Atopococcus tabaci TaxID=269774 RepID=UPI002409530B|nr:DNA translocase FtsK [Atopococcus tabaci]
MARTKKRGRPKKKKGLSLEWMGILFIMLSFFAITRLGFVGRLAANVYRFFVGDTYLVAAVTALFYGMYLLFKGKEPKLGNKKVVGLSLVYVSVLIWMHARLFGPIMNPELNVLSATWRFFFTDLLTDATGQALGGGMIGALLYSASHFLFSQIGTYIIASLVAITGILLVTNVSFQQLLRNIDAVLMQFFDSVAASVKQMGSSLKQSLTVEKKPKKRTVGSKKKEKAATPIVVAQQDTGEEPDTVSEPPKEKKKITIDTFQKNDQATAALPTREEHAPEDKQEEAEVDFEITAEEENEDYQLPPVNLLDKRKPVDQSAEYSVIENNVQKLEETFESFGVDAKVTKANLGPAVTKYEIQPATGVKVSKVVSLIDDIALSLAAKDIRMEAPIPGKSLIGIEVPNTQTSMVSFRDVIEGQTKNREKLLEVPLGRGISGNVVMADLAKMPHALIAGATGSGKSVCINGIVISLLMKAKPNEVKLMMIDPKMVELNVYNGIPHLLTPVVTNPKKAAQALNKVVQEMERRYELFAASGTRNMAGYNAHIKKHNEETGESLPTLPYIVVIVDELADLMMVASNDVEDAIIRLAQMARAAGIHMILATQRPSVDVITGIIKANIPSRIAFSVSSGTDSRTILDSVGAEKLLGRGDMLYQPMGQNKPTRVQGAFLSDEEVEAVVSFVKEQQEANYVEEMIPKDEPQTSPAEAEDELFEDAVNLVVEMQTASISLLQRRFRIGYNRAARIIDEMEMRGIVGPSEGSKPRVVNIQKQEEPED